MVKLVTKPAAEPGVVAAGEYVFKEGERASAMFLVEEGLVELVRAFAGEEVRLAVVEAGDFIGEASLFEDSPHQTSARAVSASKLLRLEGPELRDIVTREPELGLRMMHRLSRRLAAALSARLAAEVSARSETSIAATSKARPVPHPAAAPSAAPRAGKARFVHASGDEFPLPPAGEALVGRADPVKGFKPDVVLSSLDAQRSLSRRHARILREGDHFFVVEEPGVRNGTFVNGKALKVGRPVRIDDGDEVSFGLIKTIFRVG